jgi:hypothetical protein
MLVFGEKQKTKNVKCIKYKVWFLNLIIVNVHLGENSGNYFRFYIYHRLALILIKKL